MLTTGALLLFPLHRQRQATGIKKHHCIVPMVKQASADVAQDLVCARYLVELPLTTMVRGGGEWDGDASNGCTPCRRRILDAVAVRRPPGG